MKLTSKMAVGVLSVLLIIFIGSFLITLNNERNFFIEQMNSNAQDTATSLGLSLSHALHNKDKAMMLSMVQAVFDRGYFSMIEVRDMRGELLVSRYAPKRMSKAPSWFYELIQWPSSVQSAIVMSGWKQVGEVLVNSDTSYACDALWKNTVGLFFWYLLFALVSLALVYVFIHWLLRPLQRVTKQAEAICEREFPIETEIPTTPELKKVTLAMNQMVTRIKKLFQDQLQQMETLRHQSYQDALTGLGNRRYFLQQLTTLLNRDEEFCPGFVILIAIDGLDRFNHDAGFQQGDEIVKQVAKACLDFWKDRHSALIARISGSNFAILVKENDARHFVEQCDQFNPIMQALLSADTRCKIVIAACSYQPHQSASSLLAELDQVLHQARDQIDNLAYSTNLPEHNPINMDRDKINEAINTHQFILCAQSITDGDLVLHQEVFVRMKVDEKIISAGYFMPLALRYDLAHQIDHYVLDEIIANKILTKQDVALNLTEATLTNKEYRKQYLYKLKQIPAKQRAKISVELNELIVLNHFAQAMQFAQQLQKMQVKVGVDQVGIHFTPMHYLNQLPISYLKLHGSLIYDVQENQNKQFFIHYFNEMAHTLDIQVVATQIESDKQWATLKSLNLQWGQGQYLGKVHPLVQ